MNDFQVTMTANSFKELWKLMNDLDLSLTESLTITDAYRHKATFVKKKEGADSDD